MKWTKIESLLYALLSSGNFFDVTATWVEGEGSDATTVTQEIDGDLIVNELLYNFSEFSYKDIYESGTDFDDFKIQWTRWKDKSQGAINRICQTLTMDYNPLENFDRYETIGFTTKYKGSEFSTNVKLGKEKHTRTYDDGKEEGGTNIPSTVTTGYSGQETDTFTPTGQKEEKTTYGKKDTHALNEETKDKESAYNDGANTYRDKNISTKTGAANQNYDESSGTDTTTTEYKNSYHETNSKTFTNRSDTVTENRHYKEEIEISYENGDDEFANWYDRNERQYQNREDEQSTDSHLHGNIGVTKAQEMLADEINVRIKYRIVPAIVKLFAEDCLIIC